MGGVIILISVIWELRLLWGAIGKGACVADHIACHGFWMGAFGFADDYIKVIKKDKSGLPARVKLIGQISIGDYPWQPSCIFIQRSNLLTR